MSQFTGPLKVVFGESDEGRGAVLLEPLVWECDYEGSNYTVIVPAEYFSDGASTPRWLWIVLPPWGDIATRAAILHDYLCECIDKGLPNEHVLTRREADYQFRLALLALKVQPWRAEVCWIGVTAGSFFKALKENLWRTQRKQP